MLYKHQELAYVKEMRKNYKVNYALGGTKMAAIAKFVIFELVKIK